MSIKTPMSRVLGLGSAKSGTEHWWAQRVSSVALVPLTILFLIPFLGSLGGGYDAVRAAYANPFNAIVAIPAIASYCASKGGVQQLTKAAALAMAPHGIRVNAVGPGSIDTAMLAGVNDNPEALKRMMSRTPLGRVGAAREIGDVVAFLASDRASYVTGETINADGGRLALNYTV